jgi:fumarate hydratase class II
MPDQIFLESQTVPAFFSTVTPAPQTMLPTWRFQLTDPPNPPEEKSKAIQQAIEEFLAGKFVDEYSLDYFQAGAGTPLNMNFNEIIANRANEILGGKLGVYDLVHPNNHVNMAQSSNDVIPTAIRLASILYFREQLQPALQKLIESISKKGKEGSGVLKVGRTHLEDAVPMTIEQEFSAWARYIEKSLNFCRKTVSEMYELGIQRICLFGSEDL